MVTVKKCITFAYRNQVCYHATCDGAKPHVRGMVMWFADRQGFYFHTATIKNIFHQMMKNPKWNSAFSNQHRWNMVAGK